jgi:uncharacterized protein YjbJ (UPF0337 family)
MRCLSTLGRTILDNLTTRINGYFPILPQQRPGRYVHGANRARGENRTRRGLLPEGQGKVAMDRNRIIGAPKESKGAVRQEVGDAKSQAEDNVDKIEGKTQNAIGGLNAAA